MSLTFWIGYGLGVTTGPLALYLIAFYLSSRDRRGIERFRDSRTVDEKAKDDVVRRRGVGPF